MSRPGTPQNTRRDLRRSATGGAGLIDMDRAATTPLCDEARAAMEPFLARPGTSVATHGNPSGSHAVARRALRALDEAREQTAEVIGCSPGEVVFTSGGTEADNHALTGGMPPRQGVPVCSAVEHHAVLEPTLALGGEAVAVDRLGRIEPGALADVLQRRDRDTREGGGPAVGVVSVMAANNELGTLNDIEAVSAVVRELAPGAVLHTDAVQAAPWRELADLVAVADLLSVSAHKLGGPKGVGALVVGAGSELRPLLLGGAQERERRGGTHNLAGIAGFAAALAAVSEGRSHRRRTAAIHRDRLAAEVSDIDGVTETVGPAVAAASGLPADRSHLLPGHLHLLVEDVDGEELLFDLESRGVCASAASSCASGATGGSHVVAAIGLASSNAAPVRLSLSSDTTDAEVDATLGAITGAIEHLRSAGTLGSAVAR
ncbi:MAG: cysteine desulfurase family protein [Microthrixaceae bacterium]